MKKEMVIPVVTGVSIGLALSVYRLYRKRLVEANKIVPKSENNTDIMQEKSESKGFSKINYIRLR